MSLPTPYFQDDSVTIYHGDCRDILPQLEPVDLVLTDPPYGTGGWRRNGSGAGSNPSGSLVTESWDVIDLYWLTGATPAIVFMAAATSLQLLSHAASVGLRKHRAVYMRKPDPKPLPSGRIKWSVEPVWVLSRDGFTLTGDVDVFTSSTPRLGRDAEANEHPYQKPVAMMRWLLEMAPGATTILDPFMGSGTTLRAAKDLGRKAIGIEIEERYCEIAAERMAQGVLL